MRLARDQRTKDYLAKRITDGKSKIEAICLKRYIAREVFAALPIPAAHDQPVTAPRSTVDPGQVAALRFVLLEHRRAAARTSHISRGAPRVGTV